MDAPVLVTPRLEMRVHREDDIPFMMELSRDPEVTRFTGDGPLSHDDARGLVAALRAQFTARRMGRFMLLERAGGSRLGFCGLKVVDDDGVVDLGYRLARHAWGRGYATEAAQACVRYGVEQLGLERIVAHVALGNDASVHVLQKLGFRVTGTAQACGLPCQVFEYRPQAPA